MGKTTDLNAELAALHDQRADAEERRRKASLMVANNPGDTKAREHAAGAARTIADINAEIKVLEDARADAVAADKSQEVIERKAKATAHLDAAVVRIAERDVAAKDLDAALIALHSACTAWVASNAVINQELRQFYKYALYGAPAHAQEHYRHQIMSLDRIGVNGLLAQVDQALTAAEVPRNARELSFIGNPSVRESIARDAVKQSNTLLTHARTVAEREGIEIPAAAAEGGAA